MSHAHRAPHLNLRSRASARIGVAVLLAGGVMVLVTRRRRVVLVAPADERPTV